MQLKKYTLGEIAEIYNGSTPSTKELDNYDGEIIWATPKDLSMQNSKYFYRGERNITQKGFDSCSAQMIPANNILMSSRAPIGLFAINKVDCCTNQGFKNIVLNKSISDVDFMYYFLKYHVKEIESLGSGTTFKEISKTSFENFKISIPPLPVQQKIAAVLSALDEKIALNSRINAKLEAMAKRLYDYWFVQFEFPFDFAQGKPDADDTFGNIRPPISQAGHTSTAAGRSRPYKTGGGKMVWNEQLKREIPEGWEVKRLGDLDVVKRGTTITEKETTTGDIKVVAGGLDYSYTHGKSNRRENCITISGSGENAGFINFWREPIFASDCSTVQFSDDLDTIMCYFSLKMYEHIFFRKSHKSAQPHIYPADIYEMPFIIPPKEIKEKVRNFFISQNSKIAALQQQSAKLTSLRDRLLPLLMNGQVVVSDNSEQTKQNSGLDYEKKFNKWLQNQGLAARGHVDMKTLRAIFNAMDDDDK